MSQNDTTVPLSLGRLNAYVEQRIIERANLRRLYDIEWNEEEQEYTACMKSRAAASIWRVVQDALKEAGWKISHG